MAFRVVVLDPSRKWWTLEGVVSKNLRFQFDTARMDLH